MNLELAFVDGSKPASSFAKCMVEVADQASQNDMDPGSFAKAVPIESTHRKEEMIVVSGSCWPSGRFWRYGC